MTQGIRSLKYSVKYGTGIKVPNPIIRGDKEVCTEHSESLLLEGTESMCVCVCASDAIGIY